MADAKDDARKARRWAWFWRLNVPPVVVSYLVVDRDLWEAIMLLYLAVVSIWALVDTNESKAEAAQARAAAEDT